MTATLHNIKDRQRQSPVEVSHPGQFVLDAGQTVDPKILLDEAGWTPYCLDDANRRVLFVQTPPDVDLTEAVFVYSLQFEQAQRIISISYDTLTDLTSHLKTPEMVLIYSTGRCGSTLLNQIFNQVEGVYSLSEVDIHTNLASLRSGDSSRDDEIRDVLKACTLLLYPHHANSAPTLLGIKFRSLVVEVIDLFYQAFPAAHNIFMYRHGVEWTHSMYRFGQRMGLPDQISVDMLLQAWQTIVTQDMAYLDTFIKQDTPTIEVGMFFAPWWTYHLDKYIQSHGRGVPLLTVRYEDLNAQRESTLKSIFDYCGLPDSAVAQALQGFETDSQEGTIIARDISADDMPDEQVQHFLNTLAKHPRFKRPDLILPDVKQSGDV